MGLDTTCMPSAPDVVVESLDMHAVKLKSMAIGDADAWLEISRRLSYEDGKEVYKLSCTC